MAVDYKSNPAVFNKSVILIKEVSLKDSYGTPYTAWHPVATIEASIEPLSGREYWIASQSQSEASVRIIIRYRKGVNDRMRLLHRAIEGDIIYEMKSPPINYGESNDYLELMCRRFSESTENVEG